MNEVNTFNSMMAAMGDPLTKIEIESGQLVLYTGLLNMDSLKVPYGVRKIKCNSLLGGDTDVYIPRAIRQVILPDTVYYIGDNAFRGANKLEGTIQSKELTVIGQKAFIWSNIESVIAPKLICIGDDAFYNCFKLKYIQSSDCLTITDNGLNGCHSLYKIDGKLNRVGKWAVFGCDKLTELAFTEANEESMDKNRNIMADYDLKMPANVLSEYGCYGLSNLRHVNMGTKQTLSFGFMSCDRLVRIVGLGLKKVQLGKIGRLAFKDFVSENIQDELIEIIIRDATQVDLTCRDGVNYKLYFLRDSNIKFISSLHNKEVFIKVRANTCADKQTIEGIIAKIGEI